MEQEPIESCVDVVDVERSWFYTLSPCVLGSAVCLAGALYKGLSANGYALFFVMMFVAGIVMLMATDYVVKLFVKSRALYVWGLEISALVVSGLGWWLG